MVIQNSCKTFIFFLLFSMFEISLNWNWGRLSRPTGSFLAHTGLVTFTSFLPWNTHGICANVIDFSLVQANKHEFFFSHRTRTFLCSYWNADARQIVSIVQQTHFIYCLHSCWSIILHRVSWLYSTCIGTSVHNDLQWQLSMLLSRIT